MFEVDRGSGHQWPAHAAPSPQPFLEFQTDQILHRSSQTHFDAASSKYRRRYALLIIGLMLTGGAGLWCRVNVVPVLGGTGAMAQLDGLARLTGFGIDMVALTGHRFTADSDVFDALDLPNARSLVSFDTEGVRRRLERLPWVLTADLTRVFPDRLDVRITERKAVAVWMRGGRPHLIDNSGRVLSAISRSDGLNLPRISGEGAPAEAERFLTLLAGYSDVYALLEEAERVGDRRWTLHLSDGVTVHLPPEREASVLATISSGGRLASLLATKNQIIDLRSPGRIAVRAAARHAELAVETGPNP